MKIARIKLQKEFVEALEDRNFWELHLYCRDYKRNGDEILTEISNEELSFKLTLDDYFANIFSEDSQRERDLLWKKVNGKITWKILKIVEI